MKRISRKPRPIFIYAICDAGGLVRYVGQCWDVRKRIRSHLWSETHAGVWMRSEIACGRFPVVQSLMELRGQRGVGDGVFRWAATALEEWLIRHYQKHQMGELLNIAGIKSREKHYLAGWGNSLPVCREVKMRWKLIADNYAVRKARVEARKQKVETA